MSRPWLFAAMAAVAVAVYLGLGLTKSKTTATVTTPKNAHGIVLPGTIYLAQGGRLYAYHSGDFTQLRTEDGAWSQPAVVPGAGQLLAVNRGAEWSDVYLLADNGTTVRQLTRNNRSTKDLSLNHWAFYPHPAAGGEVLYSYDSPKDGYEVDLAIWQMSLARTQASAVRRTEPNGYTGGDVYPNPLNGGGVLYSKFKSDATTGTIVSELWLQLGLRTAGAALTDPQDDCGQPALSPDQTLVAMVCTGGKQAGRLEIASFDGQQLGPAVTLATGQLAAPAWSPDGRRIAYLAPAAAQGPFQLWEVDLSGGPAHPKPAQRATENLDLDATSPPAWG